MKWNGKVDEASRESIERLCQHFNRYITLTHGDGSSGDAHIIKEWTGLKTAILKDPTDLEGLERYVDRLPSNQNQEGRSSSRSLIKCRSNPGIASIGGTGVGQKREIDKGGLKRCTRRLMEAMKRSDLEMDL